MSHAHHASQLSCHDKLIMTFDSQAGGGLSCRCIRHTIVTCDSYKVYNLLLVIWDGYSSDIRDLGTKKERVCGSHASPLYHIATVYAETFVV